MSDDTLAPEQVREMADSAERPLAVRDVGGTVTVTRRELDKLCRHVLALADTCEQLRRLWYDAMDDATCRTLQTAAVVLEREARRRAEDALRQVGEIVRGVVKPAGVAPVHYAPCGRWSPSGRYDCGAGHAEPYTGVPDNVTCGECKRRSPGLWPGEVQP